MFSKQTILNTIAKYMNEQSSRAEHDVICSMAAMLPHASGKVLVNSMPAINIRTGKVDVDALFDEYELHIDAINSLADTANINYLSALREPYPGMSDKEQIRIKDEQLVMRNAAVNMLREIGFTLIDRKLTYHLDEPVSEDLVQQLAHSERRLESFVDFRVSDQGKTIEFWMPQIFAQTIINEVNMAQAQGEVKNITSLSMEETPLLIPGSKDWIDMERRVEILRQHRAKQHERNSGLSM